MNEQETTTVQPDGYNVTLFWHPPQVWEVEESRTVPYSFRVVGKKYGAGRWAVHLIEPSTPLPPVAWVRRDVFLACLGTAIETAVNANGSEPRQVTHVEFSYIGEARAKEG